MVALFGCGSSLKMPRSASILADSLAWLNWLNVSKNWKREIIMIQFDSLLKFNLPFGKTDL